MRADFLVVALVFAVFNLSAMAQTPPAAAPSQPPMQAPATPAPAPTVAAPQPGKRDVCREDAAAKRLRGQEKQDQIQLCMAQGQVDCVRQAIDQRLIGSQRKDFMQTCMGRRRL